MAPKQSAFGLQPGDMAPPFSGIDQDGVEIKSSELLKSGPLVLLFYRGQWCPVCNRHLAQLQDSLALIEDKGATVIAVSPEKPQFLAKTAEKSGAEFILLYDQDYVIMNTFGVNFRPGDEEIEMYNTRLNANLSTAQSDDSNTLPVPATFIIDTSGRIIYRHFDTDYKNRASVQEILDQLP